ncbi:MAG: chemotaxis protein CheB, partial [Nitrospirae bacterium]|nr:chemotaxis protein CheB [Nitrospirota bacterium]
HKASMDLLNVQEELIGKIEIISKIPRERIKKQVAIFSNPHPAPAAEIKPEICPQEKRRVRKDGDFPTFGSLARNDLSASGLKTGQADIVVIGASTGGPAAIQMIISSLPSLLPVPIVIVQHMPPNFTHSFARRLDSLGRLRVKEAEEGDRLWPGQVYVAPGGHNLIAKKGFEGNKLYLESKTEEDRYVPSVDKTMDSLAKIYGKGTLGVILTGMGNDGTRGIKAIKTHGGVALAESEETAVVYGMPRVPVQMGIIDQVFPINEMAEQIVKLCRP